MISFYTKCALKQFKTFYAALFTICYPKICLFFSFVDKKFECKKKCFWKHALVGLPNMAESVTVFEPLKKYEDQCNANDDTFHETAKQLAVDCALDQSSSKNQWNVFHSNKITNKHKGTPFFSISIR